MKRADCSSTDQGGGKRRASDIKQTKISRPPPKQKRKTQKRAGLTSPLRSLSWTQCPASAASKDTLHIPLTTCANKPSQNDPPGLPSEHVLEHLLAG